MPSSCYTLSWWSKGRNITSSIHSFSFILLLLNCQMDLGSKGTISGAFPLCVCLCLLHKSLSTRGAGAIILRGYCPHCLNQEEPFPHLSTGLSLSQLETRLAISQITVLKKSLQSKVLVNKSLLLLWFTAFLRTLRADFSTLSWLWGTADTVEPVPSCKCPPRAWEAADSILYSNRG